MQAANAYEEPDDHPESQVCATDLICIPMKRGAKCVVVILYSAEPQGPGESRIDQKNVLLRHGGGGSSDFQVRPVRSHPSSGQ